MAAPLRGQYTQDEIDNALAMLIAYAGNVKAAITELKEQGVKYPSPATLTQWARVTHWERYEALREKFDEKREGKLTHDMFDVSHRATEGAALAVEKAIEKLEAGKDDDPGKTAANLASVGQRMTDKGLALSGRPSRITESRDAAEILRRLVAMGVLQAPEEPKELEGALAEDKSE